MPPLGPMSPVLKVNYWGKVVTKVGNNPVNTRSHHNDTQLVSGENEKLIGCRGLIQTQQRMLLGEDFAHE